LQHRTIGCNIDAMEKLYRDLLDDFRVAA